MSASITQLASIGKQDVETTISPELTFWKSSFKRHTDFAMEPRRIELLGADYNKTATATLPRNGDLISKIWMVIDLGRLDGGNRGARFVDDVGRAIFEEIKLEIGSVVYDRMYPELEHAMEEVKVLAERQLGRLTGKSNSPAELQDWAEFSQKLYVPFHFFFTEDYGSSLPVVALHLTDVKLSIKFKQKAQLIVSTGAGAYTPTANDALLNDIYLLAETVYLGDPERDWFAGTQQKYVITQNQYLGSQSVAAGVDSLRIPLHFNHPCKELILMQRTNVNTGNLNWFNFNGEETGQYAAEAFASMKLRLNGSDRFEAQDPLYFRVIQNKEHHSRIPTKMVYTYSFALYPEDPNPSGSLNFSRIDNAQIDLTFSANLASGADWFVFARNINVATVGQGVMLLRFAS